MFEIGDYVLYSTRGVCMVCGTEIQQLTGKLCYILKPETESAMTIYVPVDGVELKMRRVITEDEISEIISEISKNKFEWIADDKERQRAFQEIFSSGDRLKIMQMLRVIYLHRQKIKKNNRKLHVFDEKMFKDAENFICDEIAFVLKMRKERVVEYIVSKTDEELFT